MMKKFRVYDDTITEHEVLKETEKFITYVYEWERFDGSKVEIKKREQKERRFSCWFSTYENAVDFIIGQAITQVGYHKKRYVTAQNRLTELQQKYGKDVEV